MHFERRRQSQRPTVEEGSVYEKKVIIDFFVYFHIFSFLRFAAQMKIVRFLSRERFACVVRARLIREMRKMHFLCDYS